MEGLQLPQHILIFIGKILMKYTNIKGILRSVQNSERRDIGKISDYVNSKDLDKALSFCSGNCRDTFGQKIS